MISTAEARRALLVDALGAGDSLANEWSDQDLASLPGELVNRLREVSATGQALRKKEAVTGTDPRLHAARRAVHEVWLEWERFLSDRKRRAELDRTLRAIEDGTSEAVELFDAAWWDLRVHSDFQAQLRKAVDAAPGPLREQLLEVIERQRDPLPEELPQIEVHRRSLEEELVRSRAVLEDAEVRKAFDEKVALQLSVMASEERDPVRRRRIRRCLRKRCTPQEVAGAKERLARLGGEGAVRAAYHKGYAAQQRAIARIDRRPAARSVRRGVRPKRPHDRPRALVCRAPRSQRRRTAASTGPPASDDGPSGGEPPGAADRAAPSQPVPDLDPVTVTAPEAGERFPTPVIPDIPVDQPAADRLTPTDLAFERALDDLVELLTNHWAAEPRSAPGALDGEDQGNTPEVADSEGVPR